MQIIAIAGAAGFIGSNLANRLQKENSQIVCIDNLSNGKWSYIDDDNKTMKIQCNLDSPEEVRSVFEKISKLGKIKEIWHMAANSDIPKGIKDSSIDVRDTFLSTKNLLKACEDNSVERFMFASSSAVYGNHEDKMISEKDSVCRPISNYGAMKLASEALIFAAKENFLKEIFIYRFPNVVGAPATHGVIYDFVKRLLENPTYLEVLGDGSQRKQYLHVDDLIDAMIWIKENCNVKGNQNDDSIYNIGPSDTGIHVSKIAEIVRDMVSPIANIRYGKSNRGWVGDIPRFQYNVSKLKKSGWKTSSDSEETVRKAASAIYKQFKK